MTGRGGGGAPQDGRKGGRGRASGWQEGGGARSRMAGRREGALLRMTGEGGEVAFAEKLIAEFHPQTGPVG